MKELSKERHILGFSEEGWTESFLTTAILDKVDAFVFIYDIAKSVPVWINQYAIRRFGYTNSDLERVTSEEFLSLFHPKSLQLFIDRLNNLKKADGKSTNTLYQLRSKSREWINMLTCTRIFKENPDGTIKYLIGYAAEVDPNELNHHMRVMKDLNSRANKFSLVDKLSPRELDVVRYIATGFTDNEIAEKLGISVHTTRTHRKRIISKLGLKNSAVLIKFAVENGLA